MLFPEMMNSGRRRVNASPLLCWDIYSMYYMQLYSRGNDREFLNHFLTGKTCDMPYDLDTCLARYDAIVITSPNQVIEWVSSGFNLMTGYSQHEVLHRKPDFLQGAKTEARAKRKVRESLLANRSAETRLTNYTKSGEPYICDIAIKPVLGKNDELLHFMAFEKELKEPVYIEI